MKEHLIYQDHVFFNPITKEKVCETQKEANKYLVSSKKILYLVCLQCGLLTNNIEELEDIETMGSMGMCYCEYLNGRIFYPFYIISEDLFKILQPLEPKQRVVIVNSMELKEW